MARLNLVTRKSTNRRKNIAMFLLWVNMMHLVNWFFEIVFLVVEMHHRKLRIRDIYENDFYSRRKYIQELVYDNDITCLEQLRMNRRAFVKLCTKLQTIGKLQPMKNMLVDEQVAFSLHLLAHHVKNRVIKFRFRRSGETISRHFDKFLNAVLRLEGELLKKPEPILETSTNEKWKWFTGCLGALDGTYIKVKVSFEDKPRYRNRKNEIATNVLGVCVPDMQFIYVLPGWEGSVADGRVLRDAIERRNGLTVCRGNYYLVDAGYTNGDGFLAPYRGQRYHLNDWRQGHQPTTAEECFNMKHSSARNVIERSFGLLKMRWAILRSHSFYPIKTTNRIIHACCLLHNSIRHEMPVDPLEDEEFEQEEVHQENEDDADIITGVETSNFWTNFRANLADKIYDDWSAGRH